MGSMRKHVKKSHDRIKESLEKAEDIDFYFGEAHFTGEYTLEVNGQQIKGKTIFIVSGARPFIPSLRGIENQRGTRHLKSAGFAACARIV